MSDSFGGGFGGAFGLMESVFPIFFILVFVIVIGGFAFVIGRGLVQYRKNNASPVLTVACGVVSRRTNVVRQSHHDSMEMDNFHSSTDYYVTFEVESGDRIELNLSGEDYGQLAEGDRGRLTFQGTRYLGFERERKGM